MNQNIIIAVDHSVHAENAVKYYLERMHRPGNRLILVHSIELPELSLHNARECHVSPAVLASMWKEEEAKCRALEDKMKILLKDKGVSARLRSCPGKPGEVVCRVAIEENAAFIVIGTHGTSALKRTVLGSVSNHIVRHAHCPVIVCRDPLEIERNRLRYESGTTGHGHIVHQSSDVAELGRPGRHRHRSGEALTTFASSLRRRFASGGGATPASRAARSVDDSGLQLFEATTVLYAAPRDLTLSSAASEAAAAAPASSEVHADIVNPTVLKLKSGAEL